MGAGWTNAEEISILQWYFGGTAKTPPASTFVALLTAEPNDDGTFAEIAYQNYARQEIAAAQWAVPSGGDPTSMANAVALTYPVAGAAGPATATYWGLMTLVSAGLILFSGKINVPSGGLPISEGIQPQFATGALILQLGDLPQP